MYAEQLPMDVRGDTSDAGGRRVLDGTIHGTGSELGSGAAPASGGLPV